MSNSLPRWRKSSRSNNTSTCVEVVGTLDQLRDSKNSDGPVLRANLGALLAEIKDGRLDGRVDR